MITFAQVAADSSVKEILNYVVEGTLLFLAGFVWRTQGIIVELRTLLAHPENGLLVQMKRMTERLDGTEEDTSKHGSRLEVHGTRLDGHDRELHEINEERRHYTRRSEDRHRSGQ